VAAGERTRVRLRATATEFGHRKAVEGAKVRIGRRKATTNRRGRASLRVRFARPGKYRVRARKAGYRPGRTRLRATNGLRPPSLR
jgi:hypothetical protein